MLTLGDFKGMNGEADTALQFLNLPAAPTPSTQTSATTRQRSTTTPTTTPRQSGKKLFNIKAVLQKEAERRAAGDGRLPLPTGGDHDYYAQEWNPPNGKKDREQKVEDLRTVDWCGEKITPEEAQKRRDKIRNDNIYGGPPPPGGPGSPAVSWTELEERPPGSNCYYSTVKTRPAVPFNGFAPIDPVDGNTGGIPTVTDTNQPATVSPEGEDASAYQGNGNGNGSDYGGGDPEGGDVVYTGGAGGGAYDKSGIEKFKDKVEDISGLPWWILLIVAGTTAYIAFKPKKKDTV